MSEFVEYGGVKYEFRNKEDAIGFTSCCEAGGRPGACAEQWNCIGKTQLTPDKSRKLGR
jgi:hypothetical protein